MASFFRTARSFFFVGSFLQTELSFLLYRSIVGDRRLPYFLRLQLTKKNKHSFYCRLRLICQITGRARAVFVFPRMCRMAIKELGLAGLITGYGKFGW